MQSPVGANGRGVHFKSARSLKENLLDKKCTTYISNPERCDMRGTDVERTAYSIGQRGHRTSKEI